MQYELKIKCLGCRKIIGKVNCDTAWNVNPVVMERILLHRKDCRFYKGEERVIQTAVGPRRGKK